MSFSEEKSLYIGGLNTAISTKELKNHLIYLFQQIGLTVKKQHIFIKEKYPDYCYAFVNINDEDDICLALDHLDTAKRRSYVPFDFSLIQEENKKLKINRKSNKNEETHILAPVKNQNVRDPQTQSYAGFSRDQQRGLSPFIPPNSYKIGEKLGNETRNAEFKEGGFIKSSMKSVIKETFGKYICSFLNTDGGTLYVGVDDNGCVVGIRCDQQEEDQIRLQIDDAIKQLNPPVFPSSYRLKFIPVKDKRGSLLVNLKVMLVTVDSVEQKTCLYDYCDSVYVRRDASVQRLKPREIQEWIRKNIEKEHVHQREVQQQLEQVASQVQKISDREQAEKDSRLKEIQQHFEQVKAENYKLKTQLRKAKTSQLEEEGKDSKLREMQEQFEKVNTERTEQLEQVTSQMLQLNSKLQQQAKKDSRFDAIQQQFATVKAENDNLKREIEEQKQTRRKPGKKRSKLCSIM